MVEWDLRRVSVRIESRHLLSRYNYSRYFMKLDRKQLQMEQLQLLKWVVLSVGNWPCHHPHQVGPGVQQVQANLQDPELHHDQLDLEALSHPRGKQQCLLIMFRKLHLKERTRKWSFRREIILTGAPFSPAGPGGPWGPGLPDRPIGPAVPAAPLSPGEPWKREYNTDRLNEK